MVLIKSLNVAPGLTKASKRAPLSPMPPPRDPQDRWGDFLHKVWAAHPNILPVRDTSEQDLWAKFLDNARKSKFQDVSTRDAGNQELWNLLIKGAQAQ